MDQARDPMLGRVLDGRYRIVDRIARGGMAMVYRATDLRLDRTVAVKVMHASLAGDPEFVERFAREARSAARLSHPNVVAVFDTGDDEGTLYLVMEHVPGRTLRDVIRHEAPFAPGRALSLLEPILRALSAAHGAHMIHRDVKPENVLLTDAGDAKVVDFGLARAVNSETSHTATGGILIGTVSYLSPELVVDNKADARADVYAAGVLLYEMLTGRKPHQADSPIQVAYKHVHEDIPAPSAVRPELPDYVDALVARATARDMELRPTDARVFLHHLRRVRSAVDQGIPSDPDLTADLLPRRTTPMGDDELTTMDPFEGEDLPGQIIDPSAPDAAEQIAQSGEFDVIRDRHDQDEHTAPVTPLTPPVPAASGVGAGVGAGLGAGFAGGIDDEDGHEDRGTDDDPAYSAPPARRRSRGPLILVGLVLLALLVGLGAWWFGSGRYTTTPGVIDLPEASARAKIDKAGLRLDVVEEEFSETVANGAVIRTDPEPGERILQDGTLKAVLSKGPERHSVPRLAGLTEEQVPPKLEQVTLTLGSVTQRFHETVPKGEVVSSTPRAGARVKRDTAVDIVISKGREPITIPDLTGDPADEAENKLTELGFEVERGDPEFSSSVRKGRVISQTPSKGTGFRKDTVTLVVSRGPEQVTVPDVRRLSYEEARTTLREAGLKVRSKRAELYIGFDRVASSDPRPGARVRKGSVVTVTLV